MENYAYFAPKSFSERFYARPLLISRGSLLQAQKSSTVHPPVPGIGVDHTCIADGESRVSPSGKWSLWFSIGAGVWFWGWSVMAFPAPKTLRAIKTQVVVFFQMNLTVGDMKACHTSAKFRWANSPYSYRMRTTSIGSSS